MYKILQDFTHGARSALAAAAVSVLAGIALLGASADAEAGYTCASNATQVGNSVTMEVVATSGGSALFCTVTNEAEIGPANISISSSVVSSQVGPTVGITQVRARTIPQGLGDDFEVTCTHPTIGGPCGNSVSGFINGVDFMTCTIDGLNLSPLPDPALPLVPVVITTVCAVNY